MKHLIIVSVILFCCCSCKKEFDITNLNNNQITVLGHGGMGISHVYPINSFESISNCLSIGADGTEIDIQMTADSVLVVFHDERLEDSTNKDGQIYEQKWAAIQDAKYNDPPYSNYNIITLDELFTNLPDLLNYQFFLDCKNFNPDTSSTYVNTFNNALIKIIDKHQVEENVFIEFKRTSLIRNLKNKRPDLKLFIYSTFENGLEIAETYDLIGIVTAFEDITKDEVETAHAQGRLVALFNARTKSRNIEAIELNVDYIQSDKVKHLIKLLK